MLYLYNNLIIKYPYKTRLLGRPQPQMYPPVALNQYTWVNRTHKHFVYTYILGASLCCTGRSMAKFLTSMLRSRSWEISIPLARKTLDMQDLYPCMEDIASFFSSNRKMRKSANCWTVALTGLICLTWHHSPNTFHLDS